MPALWEEVSVAPYEVARPAYRCPVIADDLAAAWDAVHDALPTGWTVGRPTLRSDERERPWHVLVVDLRVATLTAFPVALH